MSKIELNIISNSTFEMIYPNEMAEDIPSTFSVKGYVYDHIASRKAGATVNKKTTIPLYKDWDKRNNIIYLDVGLIFFINFKFKKYLNENSIKKLKKFKSNLIEDGDNFDNLTNEQNIDLKRLCKYRIGLFQVRTGYGKTEVIATLTKYLLNKGTDVLIITSNSKSVEEIKSRIKKVVGINISKYYSIDYKVNVINAKGFFRSSEDKSDLKRYKVVLFDEVENCMNDEVIKEFYVNLYKRKYCYGFSATSNKSDSERLIPSNECYYDPINIKLVKYFGYASIYKLPTKLDKSLCINSFMMNRNPKIHFIGEKHIVNLLTNQLFITDTFANELNYVIGRSRKCVFIPLNRTKVLEYWIEFLRNEHRICYLNHSGFSIFHKEEENKCKLEELKTKLDNDEIDVLMATKTGYNSIDLNKIESVILVLEEGVPHNVLQAVGRSRSKVVDINYINYQKRLPIYSKKIESQLELIKTYHENCNINYNTIYE